jgi:hypothetical protein
MVLALHTDGMGKGTPAQMLVCLVAGRSVLLKCVKVSAGEKRDRGEGLLVKVSGASITRRSEFGSEMIRGC